MVSTDAKQNVPVPPAAASAGADGRHTSDHLANERTFLAWIRTSISVTGLGFVVAKFSVWLRELAVRFGGPARPAHTRLSLPLGIAMMALGAALAVIAAWRYRATRIAIDQNQSAADTRTIMLVTIMVLIITASLVAYMLATA